MNTLVEKEYYLTNTKTVNYDGKYWKEETYTKAKFSSFERIYLVLRNFLSQCCSCIPPIDSDAIGTIKTRTMHLHQILQSICQVVSWKNAEDLLSALELLAIGCSHQLDVMYEELSDCFVGADTITQRVDFLQFMSSRKSDAVSLNQRAGLYEALHCFFTFPALRTRPQSVLVLGLGYNENGPFGPRLKS